MNLPAGQHRLGDNGLEPLVEQVSRLLLGERVGEGLDGMLIVADHAGYDHTEAYEALARLIRQFAAEPGNASVADLIAFVHAISAVAPR